MAKGALSFLAGLTSGYLTQKQREEDKERQEKFDQIKLDEAARNKAEWDRADKIRDDIAAAAKKEDTITDDAQVVTGISDRPSVYQNKDLAAADIREVRRMLAQAPAPLAPVSSTALTAGVTAAASNTTDATAAGISTNTNTNVSTGTSAGTSAASNTLAASANQASNGIKPGLLPAAASTAAPASASTPAATTDSTSNSTTAATTVPATATTAIAAAKTASTAPASVTAEIPGTSANGNGSILATQGTGLGRQDAAVPDQANSQAAGQTAGTTADKIADKAVDQPLDKAADIADTAANPAASAASTAASQGISMTPLNKPMFMGKEYADSAAAKKAMDAYNSPAARDARVADAYRRNGDYAGAAKAEAEAVRREAESINLQNLKTQEARKEFGRGMVSSYANGGAGGLMQFLSESPADGAGGAMKFDHTISDDGKTATVYKTDADGNRAKVAEVPNNENGWHTAMFRLQRGLDPTALYEHSLALKKQGLDDARPATEKKNAAVSRTKIADADSPLPVREKNLAATDGVWPQAARTPVMLPSRANVSAGVNNAKSNAVIDYAAQAYGELKNNPAPLFLYASRSQRACRKCQG